MSVTHRRTTSRTAFASSTRERRSSISTRTRSSGAAISRARRTRPVDVPRLIEGGVALQVFAATTKVPRHLNIERNDDRSDDIRLLAFARAGPTRRGEASPPEPQHLAHRARRSPPPLGRAPHGHSLRPGPPGVPRAARRGPRDRRRSARDRGRPCPRRRSSKPRSARRRGLPDDRARATSSTTRSPGRPTASRRAA